MANCHQVNTPMEEGVHLYNNMDSNSTDVVEY